MPIGIEQWRAGIARVTQFKSCSLNFNIMHFFVCFLVLWPLHFSISLIYSIQKSLARCDFVSPLDEFQVCFLTLLIINLLQYKNIGIVLLLSGDIETNTGPQIDKYFKFRHWNLNSICARGGCKIPLLEAFNFFYLFDVVALSETMLNSTVSNQDIEIEGFSNEIYRNDHPSDSKMGGVCLYFRKG